MRFAIRFTLRAFLVLGGLVGGVSAVARAQQGTVAGRVTDQANGQPLVGARVTVMGTSLVTIARAEGRYQIANVPAGQVTVRATLIGYAAASRSTTVGAGEKATARLTLLLSPHSPREIAGTGTRGRGQKQIRNVIKTSQAE